MDTAQSDKIQNGTFRWIFHFYNMVVIPRVLHFKSNT